LHAVASLRDHVTLTLIGRKTEASCAPLDAALSEHRWIASLPHQGVLEEMQRHDVLVFPSLFEGFGLVILEAMSQGVPVIATMHTAGPDLITDGVEGFLVPIRSAEAIARRLELLLRRPGQLQEMKAAALAKARTCSWTQYRETIRQIVRAGSEARDEPHGRVVTHG
jgi:glycosyltransferase involved in cell wall biosynthesis